MKKIIFLAVLGATLTGCYKKELESANAENNQLSSEIENLKSEITKLTAENTRLKETAQYFYQQGKNNLEASKFAEAITAFNTVVDRFPADPLVPLAKKSLVIATKAQAEEVRKKEAIQAQCKERLEQLKKFAINIAFEGAQRGYVLGGDMANTKRFYRECVESCSDKGINCLAEAQADLEAGCSSLGLMASPSAVESCRSIASQMVNSFR